MVYTEMVRDWTSGLSLPVKDYVGNPAPFPLGKTLPTTYDVIKIQEEGPISLPGFFLNFPPPQPLSDLSHANLLERGGHRSYFRRKPPGYFGIRALEDAHTQKLQIHSEFKNQFLDFQNKERDLNSLSS